MSVSRFDGIIFDMDGTLWDAVDSYCRIWNVTLGHYGVSESTISRDLLISMMGKTIDVIIENIAPRFSGDKDFLRRLET